MLRLRRRLGRPRVAVDAARIAVLRAQGHSWCAIRRETGIAQGAAPRAFYGLPKSLVASTSLILRKWPRRLSQAGLLRMPRGRPNGVQDGKPT